MARLDTETETRMAAGKPVARMGQAHVLLTFNGSSVMQLEEHLVVAPLGRPIRAALGCVLERMMKRFLRQWPVVFNQRWRQVNYFTLPSEKNTISAWRGALCATSC